MFWKIALPMKVNNYHWFMMVFSFVFKEIFVLDSKSSCGYEENDITMKIIQVHNMLLQNTEYKEDIRKWSVSYMNDDVPQQRDSASCGPCMLFFMARIRDLILVPKKKFFVN